jgi:hypothetical protein
MISDSGQFTFDLSNLTGSGSGEISGSGTLLDPGNINSPGCSWQFDITYTFQLTVRYPSPTPLSENVSFEFSGAPNPSIIQVPESCPPNVNGGGPFGMENFGGYYEITGTNVKLLSGQSWNLSVTDPSGEKWQTSGVINGPGLELMISGNVGSQQSCKTTGQVGAFSLVPSTACVAPHSYVALVKYDDLAKVPNSRVDELSVEKPNFQEVTSTDNNSNYKFDFSTPLGVPETMLVVSTLWYDKNTFAITNGATNNGGVLIPLYIVACVSYDPLLISAGCIKWQSTGQDSYSADVNFVYGTTSSTPLISPEDWELGDSTTLMADGIAAYYYSYKAITYFESLNMATLNPVSVNVAELQAKDCSKGNNAWYDSTTTRGFGALGQNTELDVVSGSGGSIILCSIKSNPYYPDIPKNAEWHEFSHYFVQELGYNPLVSCGQTLSESTRNCGFDHAGFANPASNWGLDEAIAEFGSIMISEYYGDPAPDLYPVSATVEPSLNAPVWQVWGWNDVTLPCNSYCTFSSSIPPPKGSFFDGLPRLDEELSIAAILWDLHTKMGLSAKEIFGVFQTNHPINLYFLYESLGNYNQGDIDSIFIAHGAYNNTLGDFIYRTGDKLGYTGDTRVTPNDRRLREDPRGMVISSTTQTTSSTNETLASSSEEDGSSVLPDINGSYIVSSANALLNVSIVFRQQNYSSYDYSYTVNVTGGRPFYFEMPLPNYPSAVVIYQLSGSSSNKVATINDTNYWNYVFSGPSNNSVYMTLSTVGSTGTIATSASFQSTSSSGSVIFISTSSTETLTSTGGPSLGISNIDLAAVGLIVVVAVIGGGIAVLFRRRIIR